MLFLTTYFPSVASFTDHLGGYTLLLVVAGLATGLYYLNNPHLLSFSRYRPFDPAQARTRPGNVPFFMPLLLLLSLGIGVSVYSTFRAPVRQASCGYATSYIDEIVIPPVRHEIESKGHLGDTPIYNYPDQAATFGRARAYTQDNEAREYCSKIELLHFIRSQATLGRATLTERPGTKRVLARFIVERNGYVTGGLVASGGAGRNATRAVTQLIDNMNESGPRWTPAFEDGQPVRSYYEFFIYVRS